MNFSISFPLISLELKREFFEMSNILKAGKWQEALYIDSLISGNILSIFYLEDIRLNNFETFFFDHCFTGLDIKTPNDTGTDNVILVQYWQFQI